MTDKNVTVATIVWDYLNGHGYDGLYNESGPCGCSLDDLGPCDGIMDDCVAGYKVPCDPATCEGGGGCEFHIVAEKGKS